MWVEDTDSEHLYHSESWLLTRKMARCGLGWLWRGAVCTAVKSLGMPFAQHCAICTAFEGFARWPGAAWGGGGRRRQGRDAVSLVCAVCGSSWWFPRGCSPHIRTRATAPPPPRTHTLPSPSTHTQGGPPEAGVHHPHPRAAAAAVLRAGGVRLVAAGGARPGAIRGDGRAKEGVEE